MIPSRRSTKSARGPFVSRPGHFRQARLDRSRRGFTLWEMLLVVVLLLMVMAVAWPAISRLFAEDNLQKSLSTLQLKFGAARIQALERQIPYQFCYEPGGRRFIFIPALFAESAESNSTQSTATIPWISAEELPEGYRLEGRALTSVVQTPANDSTQDQAVPQSFNIPEAWLVDIEDPDHFRGVVWSPPILIRPDGSATAAEFALIDDHNQEYPLLVRSITGTLLSLTTNRGDTVR
ncbi:MAG: prepilin-type N-terminal cleavage/methylation domain-containing protein [Planctomycetaceae bacterium]|nr:prepilin-type N-terminal cleavage/methylation domain-containing protein [Planctomycetaceae bacterium]